MTGPSHGLGRRARHHAQEVLVSDASQNSTVMENWDHSMEKKITRLCVWWRTVQAVSLVNSNIKGS
jgi:hypothetical protein